ncbi:MAG TPA: hypothetical protein VLF68_04195 [Candidatus Saccharimonadales bacterium]|nr:hypothetical protein [Candidatus Saccharimonadales bacterium]
MGDDENIVEEFFKKAGMTDAIGKEGLTKAKQNMIELLKLELENKELEKPKEQY